MRPSRPNLTPHVVVTTAWKHWEAWISAAHAPQAGRTALTSRRDVLYIYRLFTWHTDPLNASYCINFWGDVWYIGPLSKPERRQHPRAVSCGGLYVRGTYFWQDISCKGHKVQGTWRAEVAQKWIKMYGGRTTWMGTHIYSMLPNTACVKCSPCQQGQWNVKKKLGSTLPKWNNLDFCLISSRNKYPRRCNRECLAQKIFFLVLFYEKIK